MNNKTSILLSIRRDKKPPGTQRKTTLLYRSPVGYSAILLCGASLADAVAPATIGDCVPATGLWGGVGRTGSAPVPGYTVLQLCLLQVAKTGAPLKDPSHPKHSLYPHHLYPTFPGVFLPGWLKWWQPGGDIKVTQ